MVYDNQGMFAKGAFLVKAEDTQRLSDREARIDDRLDGDRPVVENTNLHYEIASRGTGLVQEFVRGLRLVDAIGRNVKG